LGFLQLFRRPEPIRDAGALAQFIDENAAFVAQKGIYEYSRARAGHYAKVLFREQAFLDAVEQSRWRAYPLGIALVTELAQGVLRPHAADQSRQRDALNAVVLAVFDRYPVPAPLDARTWSALRGDLSRRLELIGQHPPKRAMDIPEPFAEAYFNLMPIHPKLRAGEQHTIGNYLRLTMCNIHDKLIKRLDFAAVVRSLCGTERGARSHRSA
jgi:hypothetical protein